jgi:hypothetical protein
MTNNTKIKVKNRSFGSVGYTIPDLNNLHREFEFGEQKEITYEELFKLSQIPGGQYIIENYLTIDNEEVVAALLGEVEPEYYYTAADVKELLVSGTLDQLEDCLNFAPEGVIDLVKDISVQLPLNDVAKRDMIFKKTGFNVAQAIVISQDEEKEEVATPTRKSAPIKRKTVSTEESSAPVRKVVKKVTQ